MPSRPFKNSMADCEGLERSSPSTSRIKLIASKYKAVKARSLQETHTPVRTPCVHVRLSAMSATPRLLIWTIYTIHDSVHQEKYTTSSQLRQLRQIPYLNAHHRP